MSSPEARVILKLQNLKGDRLWKPKIFSKNSVKTIILHRIRWQKSFWSQDRQSAAGNWERHSLIHPRTLVCQCCGMPLTEDSMISKEPDGSFNEEYCTWCYSDGKYLYDSKEALIDFLISHMPNPENLTEEDRRTQYDGYLSQLEYWK